MFRLKKQHSLILALPILAALIALAFYSANVIPGLQSKAYAVTNYTCKSPELNYPGRVVNPDIANFASSVLPATTTSLTQAIKYYTMYSYSPSSQQYWANKASFLAQSRRDLIMEIVRFSPDVLVANASLITLSDQDKNTLLSFTTNCYEKQQTLEGVLDMAPGGTTNNSSLLQYYIKTNDQKNIFLHSAQKVNPELKPGQRVRVNGLVLDNDILFDGTNPDTLVRVVDMKPKAAFPIAAAPASAVSSQQLLGCTFHRNGVPGKYQSSILLQWMVDVGNETGVPPAILAGIARHESPTETVSPGANDNHDDIVHNNYCNISNQCGTSRCIGLMQLTESAYPGYDLCNIQLNIKLAALHLLGKAPGMSFGNATTVINAVCAYNGNVPGCFYGTEVWNDYQKCNTSNLPVASVETDIAKLQGVNGGKVAARGPDEVAASGPVQADVTVQTSQGNSVAEVTFQADGQQFATDSVPPYTASADTHALPDGPHTLTVIGSDNGNNKDSDAVKIDVDNTPPVISIAEPPPERGSGPYSGDVPLRPDVSDNATGVREVIFLLDGVEFDRTSVAPYEVLGRSTGTSNGWHTLTMRACDSIDNCSEASRSVQVLNIIDKEGPEVQIIEPGNGEHINGYRWFKAKVRDIGSGVDRIAMQAIRHSDWSVANLTPQTPEDAGEGWMIFPVNWQAGSTAFPPGVYTLRVIAWDHLNNQSIPQDIEVTINDVSAPEVQILEPANGEHISGYRWFKAKVRDSGSGINSVELSAVRQSTGQVSYLTPQAPEDAGSGWVIYPHNWQAGSDQFPPGGYILRVKVWDGNNNLTTKEVGVTIDAPADTSAPELQILEPANGEHISGYRWFKAKVRDLGSGINHVELSAIRQSTGQLSYLTPQAPEDAGSGWVIYPHNWQAGSDQFPPGNYTLRVKAWDNKNNLTTREIGVIIDSPAQADTSAPELQILEPGNGEVINGYRWFKPKVRDLGSGINHVELSAIRQSTGQLSYLTPQAPEDAGSGWVIYPHNWEAGSDAFPPGWYTLRVKAWDNKNNLATKEIGVDVVGDIGPSNPGGSDVIPPTAVITSVTPTTAGRLFSNQIVTVKANAVDAESGVAKVEFYDDGSKLVSGCTRTVAPYTCTYQIGRVVPWWSTAGKIFGVKAYDKAGNVSPMATVKIPTWY